MRRLSFVINAALLVAGGANILFGQHSGGGHSSGGGGGHAVSSSGGHSHGAPSGTTISTLSNHNPLPGQLVYPTPIGLQQQFSGYTGINRGALNSGYGRGGRLGRGYGYYGGYYLSPYYYSGFDDYGSGYGYNASVPDPGAQTDAVTGNLLGEQIAQLSAEVDAMRNDREQGAPIPMARPQYYAPQAGNDDPPATTPPVTLILSSGKQVQLKSYAVMGQNIWDFSVQPAKRIALSNVDIAASKNATEAAGGEFPDLR